MNLHIDLSMYIYINALMCLCIYLFKYPFIYRLVLKVKNKQLTEQHFDNICFFVLKVSLREV